MQHEPTAPTAQWASLALIASGALMIVLWLIFTNVHGPTSYNLDRPFLGRGMHFWGMLLGAPPNLLVAAALLLLRYPLTNQAPRRSRIGLGLAIFGLAASGIADLMVGAINAPFFVPVVGAGLLLLAVGRTTNPGLPRIALSALVVIGILELIAFAWALVPLETSDAVGGYRLYGLLAHVGTGLGWVAAGLSLWPQPATLSVPARP